MPIFRSGPAAKSSKLPAPRYSSAMIPQPVRNKSPYISRRRLSDAVAGWYQSQDQDCGGGTSRFEGKPAAENVAWWFKSTLRRETLARIVAKGELPFHNPKKPVAQRRVCGRKRGNRPSTISRSRWPLRRWGLVAVRKES